MLRNIYVNVQFSLKKKKRETATSGRCACLIDNRDNLFMLTHLPGHGWGTAFQPLGATPLPLVLLPCPIRGKTPSIASFLLIPLWTHTSLPPSWWPRGTEVALRYLPSQLPTCAPLVYSGDMERLHVSAALCFFSCCRVLPQLHLKCQQSLNNLAKTLGRDHSAGGLHVGSPPIHSIPPGCAWGSMCSASQQRAPLCPSVTSCMLFSGLGWQRCSVTGWFAIPWHMLVTMIH